MSTNFDWTPIDALIVVGQKLAAIALLSSTKDMQFPEASKAVRNREESMTPEEKKIGQVHALSNALKTLARVTREILEVSKEFEALGIARHEPVMKDVWETLRRVFHGVSFSVQMDDDGKFTYADQTVGFPSVPESTDETKFPESQNHIDDIFDNK